MAGKLLDTDVWNRSVIQSDALGLNRAQTKHPFKDEKAGHAWFDGFHWRHPRHTIRSPQPLSYCRALCANTDTVNDFLGKLGAIYGRLNLIAKPTQVYNCDKMGVSIVHKPGKGKVVCEVQQRNVYATISAKKAKTHTILSCISASGYILPSMMVYPHKRSLPGKVKGAISNTCTLFVSSKNGRINTAFFNFCSGSNFS